MTLDLWSNVDQYLVDQFITQDESLDEVTTACDAAGLPAIAVSPAQGKFLYILARVMRAERILEIGTLGGYSTIWLARALGASGRLVTLEYDPKHAAVATGNIARAGFADRVDVKVGRAIDTLPMLSGPFDLVFIDADKPGIPDYYEWAVKLSRPGTLIIVDNVVREGAVTDAASTDPNVRGVRRFNEIVGGDSRVSATTLQTVGAKGYDGLAFVVVNRASA